MSETEICVGFSTAAFSIAVAAVCYAAWRCYVFRLVCRERVIKDDEKQQNKKKAREKDE